jgi:hypothetical protein
MANIGVSKTIITVAVGPMTFTLLSRKRAKKDPAKHGKLELLGGGMDTHDPLGELVRELREEELSGILADHVKASRPVARTFNVGGVPHHLFQVAIPFDVYLSLQHSPNESLGLKLVPLDYLQSTAYSRHFTPKTQKILTKVGLMT